MKGEGSEGEGTLIYFLVISHFSILAILYPESSDSKGQRLVPGETTVKGSALNRGMEIFRFPPSL